jgi:hypothetical protein
MSRTSSSSHSNLYFKIYASLPVCLIGYINSSHCKSKIFPLYTVSCLNLGISRWREKKSSPGLGIFQLTSAFFPFSHPRVSYLRIRVFAKYVCLTLSRTMPRDIHIHIKKRVQFLKYQNTVNFSRWRGIRGVSWRRGANRKLEVLELLQAVTYLDMRHELSA